MTTVADVDRELLETAQRLTKEFGHGNAGTVLRCFGRAVRRERLRGVALNVLPQRSERLARVMLESRLAPAGSANLAPPQPLDLSPRRTRRLSPPRR